MKKTLLAAAAALAVASPIAASGQVIFGVDRPDQATAPIDAQYVWGGRQYCWYVNGWHGPGWYWCGYAFRRGYGWGGGEGWRGWRRDGDGHDRGWHRGWRHHHHDHDHDYR